VAVNCAALPENLIESELFGHLKGSFTGAVASRRGLFEEAGGGTLFLDEIGELPLGLQVKLTRALQQRAVRKIGSAEEEPVDVRVVAATNIDLQRAVAEGRFREDLFYRLNILAVHVPPLRARREDIPVLAALFLERLRANRPSAPQGFTPEALGAMVAYEWPGNVRQLENTIERAVAVADTSRIGLEALPPEVLHAGGPSSDLARLIELPYREVLSLTRDRASRDYLVALLRSVNGNVTQAAERAGMERESLHRLMKRYGVRAEDFRDRGT
jgi:DNA-binding NtrC family response regulator